jgi:hypothetical protein
MEEKQKPRGREVRSMRWLGIGTVGLDSIRINMVVRVSHLNSSLTRKLCIE